MFSKDITGSDAFREMPPSSQALYFHLGMEADDDGFLDNYKGLMRSMNASGDDLKILLTKRFVILFPSKVIVLKHWLINNTIRKDRYNETKHLDEKRALVIKENGSYTELSAGKPSGNHTATQKRIEEDRIEEKRATETVGDDTARFIHLFKEVNPSIERLYGRPPQRAAAKRLLEKHPLDWWEKFMVAYTLKLSDRFCPKALTPIQMEEKLGAIYHYAEGLKGEKIKGNNFIL